MINNVKTEVALRLVEAWLRAGAPKTDTWNPGFKALDAAAHHLTDLLGCNAVKNPAPVAEQIKTRRELIERVKAAAKAAGEGGADGT